jgi:hypothetical protein
MNSRNSPMFVRFLFAVLVATTVSESRAVDSRDVVKATLNGFEITLDAKTGGILGLAAAGPGKMLEAPPETAGIIELACPDQKRPALRRASRFSPAAKITRTAQRVTIHWNDLGANRSATASSGPVAATVTLEAAADGRSVIAACRVENHSDATVTQVLFPDFVGFVPFGGAGQTQFRTGGNCFTPFVNLRPSPPEQLAGNPTIYRSSSGNYYGRMRGRWTDLGSLAGGLSLFSKQWGLDPPMTVWLHLWDTNQRLRVMFPHDVKLARGQHWESGQFVLTPHVSGWAKGIEPYRQWVREKVQRPFPMPDHVRKGMGFRTVFMCHAQPLDPQDADFTFRDLPRLAQESKQHGLDELNLWYAQDYFDLPLPPFFQHLGGDTGFAKAVAECRKLGVRVSVFIDVVLLRGRTAARYGTKLTESWTYHPEFIPRMNPPYAGAYRSGEADVENPFWRAEVLASCKRLSDRGVSISWDVFHPKSPSVVKLVREIRTYARQRDPQSAFSGEDCDSVELAANDLDYTWNWVAYGEHQGVINAFPAPRFNSNIDDSPAAVKRCLLQNSYMNVQPRKADGANGSDWIANHPELSQVLKQCAKLHGQFLPYFVDGTVIGDCILEKPCGGAAVGAFLLPGKALVLVLNIGDKGPRNLDYDLAPWVPSSSDRYVIKSYDGRGRLLTTGQVDRPRGRLTTAALDPLDVAVFEIVSQ